MMAPVPTPTSRPPISRAVLPLLGTYLALSWTTVAALAVIANFAVADATQDAWIRGVIVACTSVITFWLGRRAVTGDHRAALRLRLTVVIILIAIIGVLLFLHLPAWMIIEQATCAVLLLAVAILAFLPYLHTSQTER